jgi:hypothetical protein
VSLRVGYHDLLDPGAGFTPDSQIQLLAASVRRYERLNQVRLEQFTFANILSLSPMDSLFKSPSWKLNLGLNTVRQERAGVPCRYCGNGNFNAGVGAALEGHLFRREVYFSFAEVDANVSRAYEERHRAGGGGTVGVFADVTDRWKLLLSTSYLLYPLGERSTEWRATFQQRYTLDKNLALRTELNHRAHNNEALITIHTYF